MKRILGPLMALFFIFATATTAVAPSKPREISTFEPVTFPNLGITDNWLYPHPSGAPRAVVNIKPVPIIVPIPTIKILTPPAPVGHTVADAKEYALIKLGATQFACLDNIANKESHWRTTATNSTSGAYGIGQALPGSKMAPFGADWKTNPVTQVKWMIYYVTVRYGSACQAWSFWLGHFWY